MTLAHADANANANPGDSSSSSALSNKIQPLPPDTVSSICAGQVITDVASAVKELIENSIDAGATTITVTLVDHGRKSLTVTDNGSGIAPQDRPCMARRYYTSKLRSFQDLDSVPSLGFRGEALHSLATLCQSLTITTRTATDKVAGTYTVDTKGEIVASKVGSANVGTCVCATNLFHTLPVRRTTLLKKKENLKPLLHTYALAYPSIQFTLVDGTDRWVKPASKSLRDAIRTVHGRAVADSCLYLDASAHDYLPSVPNMAQCTLTVVLPLVSALTKDSKPFASKPALYTLNRRPIKPPRAMTQAVKSHLERAGCRSAFHVVALTLPPGTFDINVDPAKSQVISECIGELVQVLDRVLARAYEPLLPQAISEQMVTDSSLVDSASRHDGPSTAAPPTPPHTSSSQAPAVSPTCRPIRLPEGLAPASLPFSTQPAPAIPMSSISSMSASLSAAPPATPHLASHGHPRALAKPVSIHTLLTPRASGGPNDLLGSPAGAPEAETPSVHRIRALASDDDDDDEDVLLVAPPASHGAQPHHGGLFTPSKSPGASTPRSTLGAVSTPVAASPSQVTQRVPRASQVGRERGQPTLFAYMGKKNPTKPPGSQSQTSRRAGPQGVAAAQVPLQGPGHDALTCPQHHATGVDAGGPSPARPELGPSVEGDAHGPARLAPPRSVHVHLADIRAHLLAAATRPPAPSCGPALQGPKSVGLLVGERFQVVLVNGDVLWIEPVTDGGNGWPVWSLASNGPCM